MGSLARRSLAEVVGTAVLVLCGLGTAVLGGDAVGQVGIGGALGAAIYLGLRPGSFEAPTEAVES